MDRTNTRKGFSLIEAAIVLGVVGLVIGGIWVSASAMYENYKINKTVEGIATIVKNTQKMISASDAVKISQIEGITCGSLGSDLGPTLIAANGVPRDWVSGSSDLVSPFGGVLEIRNYCTGLSVRLFGLNRSECIKILVKETSIMARAGGGSSQLTSPSSGGASLNLIGSSSEGGVVQVNFPNWLAIYLPVTQQQAISACSLPENNSIFFYYSYTRIN